MANDPLDLLTPRQRDIYEFIRARIAVGLSPTVREIGVRFGIKSPNGVICNLRSIQRKGLIERDPIKARSIRLSGLPHAVHVALSGPLADRVRSEAGRDGVTPSAWVEALVAAHFLNQSTNRD